MFDFLKRRREQAKMEGRREALEKVGEAIAKMFQDEMADFMKETSYPSLLRCVEVFKLRTEQNIFVDPNPDLKPQQILKKEWDFFEGLLIEVAKRVKEGIREKIDAFVTATGPVDKQTRASVAAQYHASLALMIDEMNELGKAHLAAVLDAIHTQERRSMTPLTASSPRSP